MPASLRDEPPGGTRGEVQGFSRESRKRLMQLFASIDTSHIAGNAAFVTLTYPKVFPQDWQTWKRHFQAYLKALEREYPTASTIWKLELQKRGAPHWHLLVIGVPDVDKAWCTRTWGRIAHGNDRHRGLYATTCKPMTNYDQAALYCSKYVAKVGGSTVPVAMGRIWGVRRKGLLPITLLECEIGPDEASLLKRGIIALMAPETVNFWLLHGHGGCWTMIDGAAALRLVYDASDYQLDWRLIQGPAAAERLLDT